jgi:hypothetical protein
MKTNFSEASLLDKGVGVVKGSFNEMMLQLRNIINSPLVVMEELDGDVMYKSMVHVVLYNLYYI